MLDQDADEPLERAEDCPVQHQRMMLLPVGADVHRAEALGHVRVQLVRPALPGPADRVGQVKFELGTIEGALARQDFIVEPGFLERGLEIGFGAVPLRVAADALVGAGRQLHLVIGETEVAVDEVEQRAETLGFID